MEGKEARRLIDLKLALAVLGQISYFKTFQNDYNSIFFLMDWVGVDLQRVS